MANDLQQTKEEIRSRADIVEIIGQYTRLTRAGKNWKGLCPFHGDRNPSFNVSPGMQIYKCFSCGESGDVFTFIQKKENLDFLETLEFLAKRYNIPFERRASQPEQASEREEALELNQIASRYYQDRLALSPEAQDYLARRALLKSTQEEFEIGYASPDWEGLVFHLQKKGANLALAAKIGLIKARQADGSGHYDAYRNRIMFPIHDMTKRVIGFGGRALGDDPAKYLNSEQSLLFDKSRTLYGLCFARKNLSEKTPPVFVEGYVDVIAAHQAGFKQCVATLGTSMTEEHARLLARYSPRVLICYDADPAGIKATLRGAAVWEALSVEKGEVRIVRLPEGDDPDSLLRRGETAAFQNALDNAVPRVDFQIELALKEHPLTTQEGRAAALDTLLPILATIKPLTRRDLYIQRYAYLHPSYHHNMGRAVTQIAADVEDREKHLQNPSAREKGYPLTERSNGKPLAENTPYRPNLAGNFFQNTKEYIGKDGYGKEGAWKKGDRRKPKGMSDPTRPPLNAPLYTRAQKAERQLLRALFYPEWRVHTLNYATSEKMISEEGQRLFERIARTPADEEGNIDTLQLLYEIEDEEDWEIPKEENSATTQNNILTSGASLSSQKLSLFLRSLLEESSSILSNEPLTEAVIAECLRKLGQYRAEQASRELILRLHTEEALTDEDRTAYQRQLHQKSQELRGLPPDPLVE